MNENGLKVIAQHKEIIKAMTKSVEGMTSAILVSDPSRHTSTKMQEFSAKGLIDIHERYEVDQQFEEFERVYAASGDLFFKSELKEYYAAKENYFFVLGSASVAAQPKRGLFDFMFK